MEESTKIEFDEAQLEEIQGWLVEGINSDGSKLDHRTAESLNYCLQLIEQLRDENASLWFMLDENKKSRWTAEHSVELGEAIDKQLAVLKMLQLRKGEA